MNASTLELMKDRLARRERPPARRLENDPVLRRWAVAKRVTWMILLAGAYLFYYLIDKMHEAVSLLG